MKTTIHLKPDYCEYIFEGDLELQEVVPKPSNELFSKHKFLCEKTNYAINYVQDLNRDETEDQIEAIKFWNMAHLVELAFYEQLNLEIDHTKYELRFTPLFKIE